MFPLKTLIVAVILAMAFAPRVSACPAHNHMQTVAAPAAVDEQTAATTPAAEVAEPAAPSTPVATEVAAADQSAPPAN